MNGVTIAIFAGLLAAVGYGIADFLGAKASKDEDAFSAAFCVSIIGLVGFSLWYATQVSSLGPLHAAGIWYAVPASVLIAGGLACLYKAFEIGPVSLASPLGAAYPLVTTVVGLVFFNASLTVLQCLGIVLVVLGVMVASGLLSRDAKKRKISKGPAFALLASAMWGVGYPLLYQSIDRIGWQHATMLQYALTIPVLGLVLLQTNKTHQLAALVLRMLKSKIIIATGLIQLMAILAINIGLSYEGASGALVAAASSMYPAITIVLALRHFKEKVAIIPLTGAAVSIFGIIVLSI